MLECWPQQMPPEAAYFLGGERRQCIRDDVLQPLLTKFNQVEGGSYTQGMVTGAVDEHPHRGDSSWSKRHRHSVDILPRDIVKCLSIHRLKYADQGRIRSDPHQAGSCGAFHLHGGVLRSEGRHLTVSTVMKQFGNEIGSCFIAPSTGTFSPVRP